MANPSKHKGSQYETLIAEFVRRYFPHAERNVLHGGSADVGDITGVHDLVVQCKFIGANRQDSLPGWLDDARQQARNADVSFGVVAHKRRGAAGAAEQFVTMSLADFMRMYVEFVQLQHDAITRRAR